MKDLFPGHFKESDDSLKQVWDTCIFAFDANILLNFYRYSDSTKNEFLQLLTIIKDRVWLPHRAAEEYLSNRLPVIGQQERSYDDTVKSINALRSDLENARQHPFVNNKTMKEVEVVFSLLCKELAENKSVHTKRIYKDEIKDSISTIFEGNVGEPYSKEELEKIISDGEDRYKQKIPPGFKDIGKGGDTEGFAEKCRKYGDLIVWKQVIRKSVESGCSVILVTDDKKDDWWERFSGKTVGPRPELVKEFKECTGNSFCMYQADRFLELARENLNQNVSEEIVEEIREVRRRDKLAQTKKMEIEYAQRKNIELDHLLGEIESLRYQIADEKLELKKLDEKRYRLRGQLDYYQEQGSQVLHESGKGIETESVSKNLGVVSEEYNQVIKSYKLSSSRHRMLQKREMELKQEFSHLVGDSEH